MSTALIIISGSSFLEYGSVSGGSSIILAGTVDEDKYDKLLINLEGALAMAVQRRGRQRTAAGGKQGTPCMRMQLLLDDI